MNRIMQTITIGAALAAGTAAHGQIWNEVGDAGQFFNEVQVTEGAGPLASIVGVLQKSRETPDRRDMYAIRITDPHTFSASVVGATADAVTGDPTDTTMYLFNDTGRLVVWNDDFGGTVESAITDQGVFEAGVYYLAVVILTNGPRNEDLVDIYSTDLWPGPDDQQRRGVQSLGPLGNWDAVVAPLPEAQSYTITLTGAAFARDLAGAEDYWVPVDFATIQDAATAAASGDTIHITPGTYLESDIDLLGKSLTLRGMGSDYSVIDAQSAGRVIAINSIGAGTVFEELTFRNGTADFGGAIVTTESFTARRCRFQDNEATGAGAHVFTSDGAVLVEQSEFIGGFGNQTLIRADNAGTTMIIRDSVIRDGAMTGSNCGVLSAFGARVTIERSELRNNSGAGPVLLASDDGVLTIQDSLITDNAMTGTPLVRSQLSGILRSVNTTYVNNSTTQNLALGNATTSFLNSIFDDNTAPGGLFGTGVTVHRSIYAGATGDNIDADPMFLDAVGGDYRLAIGSPAIDAGDSRFPFITALGVRGAGGVARPADSPDVADTGYADATSVVDIGAYEASYATAAVLSCLEDFNGDGVVNGADLGLLLGAWGMCP